MATTILLRGGTVLYHNADDHVTPLECTDILIEGNLITKIGNDLDATPEVTVIDCRGKIISPGLIDTHHHLWQTQLKGRHADETLLDYMFSGNLQSYNYSPNDIFWGQLGGCLEAIDAGTTFVLDHMHGAYSAEHASQSLQATVSSCLRSVYAYALPTLLTNWTKTECIPQQDIMPDWAFKQLEEWATEQPFADGRVHIGLGFDFFFLPKEVVIGVFRRFRKAGVKVITCHVAKNAVFGMHSTVSLLSNYGLLCPDIVISHGNGLDQAEKKILSDAGVYISSTPDTECQMGLGWPVALEPAVKGSLGVDCHSNNTSSILSQARAVLQMARQETNQELLREGKFPNVLRGDAEKAFNLATIDGAKAVGMGDTIGRIAEGYMADLVIFDTSSPSMICASQFDPLVAVLRHSDIRDVDTVIIDGKVRKQHGKLLPITLENGAKMEWGDISTELLKSRDTVHKNAESVNKSEAREVLMGIWHIDGSKFGNMDGA